METEPLAAPQLPGAVRRALDLPVIDTVIGGASKTAEPPSAAVHSRHDHHHSPKTG